MVRVDVKQTHVWDFLEEEGWWPVVTMTSTATRCRCRAPQATSMFPSRLPNQTSCKGGWLKIVYILTTNNDWTGMKHYIWNLPHWIFLFHNHTAIELWKQPHWTYKNDLLFLICVLFRWEQVWNKSVASCRLMPERWCSWTSITSTACRTCTTRNWWPC